MLNLLPWRHQQARRITTVTIYSFLLFTGILLSLFTLMWMSCCHQVNHACYERNLLSFENSKKQKLKNGLATMVSLGKADLLAGAMSARQNLILKILVATAELLPESSYLTSIQLQNQSVLMEGVLLSSSNDVLINFIKTMKLRLASNFRLLKSDPVAYQKIIFKLIINPLGGTDVDAQVK